MFDNNIKIVRACLEDTPMATRIGYFKTISGGNDPPMLDNPKLRFRVSKTIENPDVVNTGQWWIRDLSGFFSRVVGWWGLANIP